MMKKIVLSLLALMAVACLPAQVMWHDPLEGTVPYVGGRAWNEETGKNYDRMPARAEQKVTPSVWWLSHNSAGMSVRFVSNSPEITVKYTVTGVTALPNVVALSTSGVDLYATDLDGNTAWVGNHLGFRMGSGKDTIVYRYTNISYHNAGGRGSVFQLFLPLYNTVSSLSIGVKAGSEFKFLHESAERPLVVYGTSIAQGASASRPGMAWTNIVERRTDIPVVNLGFSGSGKMEPGMYDMLAEIDARAFLIDCVPNMTELRDSIVPRTVAGIRKLRAHSKAPILLVETIGNSDSIVNTMVREKCKAANRELRKAYEELRREGVADLYYMTQAEIGMTEDAEIDAVHPTDVGMELYAQAYVKKIQEMFPGDRALKEFVPRRQRRDGCYEWSERHNEVLKLNRTQNPEILMIGNSITHFWGGLPASNVCNGGKTWKDTFGKRRVTNMGFGWDRIENVYWRIFHGELDDCHPKHICMNIGTNNLGMNTNEEIADGIVALAKLIRERQPQARLHVLEVYPRKGMEQRVRALNDLVAQRLVKDDHLDLIDLTPELTLKDGSGLIDSSLFLEGLHPNEKGYARIGAALKKVLK